MVSCFRLVHSTLMQRIGRERIPGRHPRLRLLMNSLCAVSAISTTPRSALDVPNNLFHLFGRKYKLANTAFVVLADDALKILGRAATSKEKFILGGAKFYDDITITHSDNEYFQRHYETKFDPSLCAEPSSKAQAEQIAFAKGEQRGVDDEPSGYRPMYYTKSYKQDPKKIEMSFDCKDPPKSLQVVLVN